MRTPKGWPMLWMTCALLEQHERGGGIVGHLGGGNDGPRLLG